MIGTHVMTRSQESAKVVIGQENNNNAMMWWVVLLTARTNTYSVADKTWGTRITLQRTLVGQSPSSSPCRFRRISPYATFISRRQRDRTWPRPNVRKAHFSFSFPFSENINLCYYLLARWWLALLCFPRFFWYMSLKLRSTEISQWISFRLWFVTTLMCHCGRNEAP